jgi:hypothetical protein
MSEDIKNAHIKKAKKKSLRGDEISEIKTHSNHHQHNTGTTKMVLQKKRL